MNFLNFSQIGDSTEIMTRILIVFTWLITIGSEVHVFKVKLDESYRWRHQPYFQKTSSKTAKNGNLKTQWINQNFDFGYVFILWIPRTTFSSILQNLIGRSGNLPWMEISEKWKSLDWEEEKFYFFVLSITFVIVSNVILRFLHFRVTWLNYLAKKKSSYSFWNHRC